MNPKIIHTVLLLALLLAACTPAAAPLPATLTPTGEPPPPRASATPAALPTPTPFPLPSKTDVGPKAVALPEGQDGYDPLPGEEKWERIPAIVTGGEGPNLQFLPKVYFNLQGLLPTPCHLLRAEIPPADAFGEIHVQVYAVVAPGQVCVDVVAPFEANLYLGEYPTGAYTVWVNGAEMGKFETGTPSGSQPGGPKLEKATLFIEEMGVVMRQGEMPQAVLLVSGSLPTPCHEFHAEVAPPNEKHEIYVEVYSLLDPALLCIQVLKGFSEEVGLGALPAGTYTVWVNGVVVPNQ